MYSYVTKYFINKCSYLYSKNMFYACAYIIYKIYNI